MRSSGVWSVVKMRQDCFPDFVVDLYLTDALFGVSITLNKILF